MNQRAHYEKAEMCLDLSEQADPESADRLLKAAQVHAHLAGDYKPQEEWSIDRAKIGQIALSGSTVGNDPCVCLSEEPCRVHDDIEDVTEEPPVGSQVTDRDGNVLQRFADGWTMWCVDKWGTPGYRWVNLRRNIAPLRLTTDADRERVGLPVDTAPDVDPDEALRFIHPDAYDRERKWHGEQRVRAEKAEADLRDEVAEHDKTRATVLRLTRERDEALGRAETDRSQVNRLTRERNEAEGLAERLRDGIDDLRRDAMTANAVEPSRALHETASRCAALLNPTEGETRE